MAGLNRRHGSPLARAVATFVLVLSASFVAGSVGWSFYLCHYATYSCPANGCDSIPQQNCQSSLTLALYVLAVGVPTLVIALAGLLRLRRPNKSERTRDAA